MEIGVCVERCRWPHAVNLGAGIPAELEAERRLLYVAMTRAKDDLQLVVPQRFFTRGQQSKGDRHVHASVGYLDFIKPARLLAATPSF